MRIDVHPSDLGGCGHYRMVWPALAVRDSFPDIDLRISEVDSKLKPSYEPDMTGALSLVWQKDEHGREHVVGVDKNRASGWPDVMVIQRPLRRVMVEAIIAMQNHGVKIVVEIDDDFSNIHPKNVAFDGVQPRTNPDKNYIWLEHGCAIADLVTVTTPELARRYAKHGRVVILPNRVPARYLTARKPWPHRHIDIGWSGSLDSHPTDLKVVGNAIAQVARNQMVELYIIGTGIGVAQQFGVREERVKASGWVDIFTYPNEVAKLDIGIVPLEMSSFNNAKSWLKGLEMAACGVPFIASPTEPYRMLERSGIGSIASSPKEWHHQLRQLIASPDMREDLGSRYREAVQTEGLLIEEHAAEWALAWTGAVASIRSSSRVAR